MKAFYFSTPTAALAVNFKVASSTLARAVMEAHHPAVVAQLTDPTRTHYPEGANIDSVRWQGICPKVAPSERNLTLVLVREPVDKFISACAEVGVTDIPAKLTELEAGENKDMHFFPQSRLLYGNNKLYRFPLDLDALATDAGLALPLPDIDGGADKPKPTLTTAQKNRVKAIYADDLALFDSIENAGQSLVTPIPVPVPPPAPQHTSASRDKFRVQLLALFGITFDEIRAVINSTIADPLEREMAIIDFEEQKIIYKNHPLIVSISALLGKTQAQVDDLFNAAQ